MELKVEPLKELRVLYVPTEEGEERQVGIRRPLANLRSAGLLAATSVFSLRQRIERHGDAERQRQDLVEHVAAFRPTVVIAQHLGGTGLTDAHFTAMRSRGQFRFIYQEGDPYRRPLHPLPSEARAAGRAADVVFTIGAGDFIQNFRRAGARDPRFAPWAFEAERFPLVPPDSAPERRHDVVVVANRNRPRWRGHPDWRRRIEFVTLLQKRLGDRVAVYGRNWTGAGAMGPVPFSQQASAVRDGWVSANWDHYASEPKYFSNRLPTQLALGTVHATTRHPGYDEFFPADAGDYLLLADEPAQLVDRIEQYLGSTTPEQRIAASVRAQAYAFEHLRQDDQLVEFFNAVGAGIDPDAAHAAWNLDEVPLDEI